SVWVVEKFIWIWLGHGFEPWPIVEQKEDKSREHVKVLGMVIGLRDGLLVLGMGLWSIRHGWAYAFHQDKASLVRVPVANVTLSSSAQLL
ncbi:hypothetical protein Tco_0831180, partial [Tanacetum coccineum]